MSERAPSGGRAMPVIDRLRLPRSPQLALLVPVLALGVLLAVARPHQLTDTPFRVGVGLVLVATLLVGLAPTRLVMVLVPLLDLAAVAALQAVPDAGVAGALVVVPAMWLGAVHRTRGVLLATVASGIAFTVPIVVAGHDFGSWSRLVLLSALALVSAVGMTVLAGAWAAQRSRLEEQGAELARLLGEVEGQRQLTDAVVRTVDVGLLALGPDGQYESMNPRQREFLRLAFPDGHRGNAGQTGAVYAADNLTELTYPDMPSVRAMNGETFSDHTVWIGDDPGSRLALSVSARPLVGERGDVEGAVLAYHDITDLMRALRVKDDFVAAVSHELRTPLTSIIGYLDLAADHNDAMPPEVVHYLSVAERNADRLLVLVSDLLTAAQAEGTTMRLTPEPTDLTLLVRAAVDGIAQRARVGGLQVRTHVEQMPRVVADPCRVAQVLDNLLSNAVKYTPSDGHVDVSLERGETGVTITVQDTGMGVAEGDQSSLFTKFFRARNATERAIPGVGLGLVITKAIVDAHGGTIDLHSQEGVGTTVRVTLPFVPTGPVVPAEVETPVEQP